MNHIDKKTEVGEVIALIEDIENEDETIKQLEEAMEFYCGTWDKCEGYKHALILCLKDQYQNHEDDQDPEDLKKLVAILRR